MKKKILISVLVLLPILGILIYLYLRKRDDETSDTVISSTDFKVNVPSPPGGSNSPATPPINGIVSLGAEKPNIYDVNGENMGTTAIKSMIEQYLENDDLIRSLKSSKNVGNDIFNGVSARMKPVLKSYILGQFEGRDENDIPLLPNFISRRFEDALKAIINSQDIEQARNQLGEGTAEKQLSDLCDLTNIVGYRLCLDANGNPRLYLKWIDNPDGYGQCAGSRRKREACDTRNWKSFQADMKKIASNLIVANDKFSNALEKMAIADLRQSGWFFLPGDNPTGKNLIS